MTSKYSNKRGSVLDILVYVLVVFGFAIVVLIGSKVGSEMNTELQAGTTLDANAKSMLQQNIDRFATLFDSLFLVVFVFMFLAIVIGAYYYKIHPVVFIFAIVILAFALLIGGIFANVFSDISNSSAFSSEISKFSIMPFVMNNFIFFICLLGFSILLMIYAKGKLT